MALLWKRIEYAEFHDSVLQIVLTGKAYFIWCAVLLYEID